MIDAHCHIDQYPKPISVAQQAEKHCIHTVAVTTLPSHYEIGLPHLRGFSFVRLAVGMHPMLAHKYGREMATFRKVVKQADFIGEVGLDFSAEGKATQTEQVITFRSILECLQDRPRFITLHSRAAAGTVLDLLEEYRIGPVVFHWFTDSIKSLERALDQGHYFSINTAMTQSKSGRIIINSIPLSRLLTETDGPHVKIRGSSAKPTDIPMLCMSLATLRNLEPTEIQRSTTANFMTLLSICQKQ